jgi:hypothetical protein
MKEPLRSGSDTLSVLAAWAGALLLGLWLLAFTIGLDSGHPPPGILVAMAALFGSFILGPAGTILGGAGLRRALRQGRGSRAPLLALVLNIAAIGIAAKIFFD